MLGISALKGDILLPRLNINGKPIANKYCEGKMKRTLERGLKDLKPFKRKRSEEHTNSSHTVISYAVFCLKKKNKKEHKTKKKKKQTQSNTQHS